LAVGVDTYDIRYIDRYGEELWDTMLAKAPEITLFNWDALLEPVAPGDRDAWKSLDTTFNYDAMRAWHQASGIPGPWLPRLAIRWQKSIRLLASSDTPSD
jgi:hypothetical protein